ncbi:hypothetical protein EK904_006265 [Melospiza melodia maxima]|nr:hypothetical protein EK904_006265 [Melospiza melodia maxima]
MPSLMTLAKSTNPWLLLTFSLPPSLLLLPCPCLEAVPSHVPDNVLLLPEVISGIPPSLGPSCFLCHGRTLSVSRSRFQRCDPLVPSQLCPGCGGQSRLWLHPQVSPRLRVPPSPGPDLADMQKRQLQVYGCREFCIFAVFTYAAGGRTASVALQSHTQVLQRPVGHIPPGIKSIPAGEREEMQAKRDGQAVGREELRGAGKEETWPCLFGVHTIDSFNINVYQRNKGK